MLIYHRELSLEEGFTALMKPKKERLVQGVSVSAASGLALFHSLWSQGKPLRCWHCGIEGTSWVSNRGQNDSISKPVLDLFSSENGRYVLMTRDHIIPKSLGGVDDIKNLRVGCSDCNGARGNTMSHKDKKFMKAHPELIDAARRALGDQKRERHEQEKNAQTAARQAARDLKQVETP